MTARDHRRFCRSVSLAGIGVVVCALAACTPSSTPTTQTTSEQTLATPLGTPSPHSSQSPPTTHPTTETVSPSVTSRSPADTPVIVIDPGHSVTVHGIDLGTGLNVSDYENEPEMRDVFAVAQLTKARLTAAGYRVILTKASLDTPTTLGQRADIANAAHAALALSIHDQAGASGGIQFDRGNNIVYYQSVGTYRETPAGKNIEFTNSSLAAVSKNYGQMFQRERETAQGTSITLQGNTGYNLGSRGLPSGDIWMVQLLSKIPWIYNEAGGNSAGRIGLSQADEIRYANGLVAAVEACIPIKR